MNHNQHPAQEPQPEENLYDLYSQNLQQAVVQHGHELKNSYIDAIHDGTDADHELHNEDVNALRSYVEPSTEEIEDTDRRIIAARELLKNDKNFLTMEQRDQTKRDISYLDRVNKRDKSQLEAERQNNVEDFQESLKVIAHQKAIEKFTDLKEFYYGEEAPKPKADLVKKVDLVKKEKTPDSATDPIGPDTPKPPEPPKAPKTPKTPQQIALEKYALSHNPAAKTKEDKVIVAPGPTKEFWSAEKHNAAGKLPPDENRREKAARKYKNRLTRRTESQDMLNNHGELLDLMKAAIKNDPEFKKFDSKRMGGLSPYEKQLAKIGNPTLHDTLLTKLLNNFHVIEAALDTDSADSAVVSKARAFRAHMQKNQPRILELVEAGIEPTAKATKTPSTYKPKKRATTTTTKSSVSSKPRRERLADFIRNEQGPIDYTNGPVFGPEEAVFGPERPPEPTMPSRRERLAKLIGNEQGPLDYTNGPIFGPEEAIFGPERPPVPGRAERLRKSKLAQRLGQVARRQPNDGRHRSDGTTPPAATT
jgi:hypothetical protein